jgi:hypothetical protein
MESTKEIGGGITHSPSVHFVAVSPGLSFPFCKNISCKVLSSCHHALNGQYFLSSIFYGVLLFLVVTSMLSVAALMTVATLRLQ